MEQPIFKYKDLKELKAKSRWVAFVDEMVKRPRIIRIVRILLFPLRLLLLPFRPLLLLGLWAPGHQLRLYRKGKFEAAYAFGMDRLSKMKRPNPESVSSVSCYHNWWTIFGTTCNCAEELPGTESLKVLSEVVERGPEPHGGYEVSEAYGKLARLYWTKGDSDNAWLWVEKAVESDDSNGYPYMLRAWMGQLLKKGQPLADLITAIQHQPELEEWIFKDEMFLKEAPELLKLLKSEVSAPATQT